MWNGKVTKELRDLFSEYSEKFYGCEPDEYDELYYDAFTYEEFVAAIKESLKKGVELPGVVF